MRNLDNNSVVISDKKITAEGWQRRLYQVVGKIIVLKPTPLSLKIEKKSDSKRVKM